MDFTLIDLDLFIYLSLLKVQYILFDLKCNFLVYSIKFKRISSETQFNFDFI